MTNTELLAKLKRHRYWMVHIPSTNSQDNSWFYCRHDKLWIDPIQSNEVQVRGLIVQDSDSARNIFIKVTDNLYPISESQFKFFYNLYNVTKIKYPK